LPILASIGSCAGTGPQPSESTVTWYFSAISARSFSYRRHRPKPFRKDIAAGARKRRAIAEADALVEPVTSAVLPFT